MSAPAAAERPAGAAPLLVWELPVRLCHWGIALSIFTLSFTGFYIGKPFLIVAGEARDHFVMGTMKAIHTWAAMVFTASLVVRIYWMFRGNHWARWHQFLPVQRRRLRKFWEMFFFYSFLRRDPPVVVGHNPLAGLAYLGIIGLCLFEVLTGLALYAAGADVESPLRGLAFLAPLLGGLQLVRWLHHAVMWLLLGFFVHHLAAAILVSRSLATGTMESIFSGFKFITREQLEEDLGRSDE